MAVCFWLWIQPLNATHRGPSLPEQPTQRLALAQRRRCLLPVRYLIILQAQAPPSSHTITIAMLMIQRPPVAMRCPAMA